MPRPIFVFVAALGALGGCATASSSSFTQAPLFFSIGDEGGQQVAADDTLAPYGTLDRGVANYSVVGGNALLPVRAVTPLDAGVQANLLGAPVQAGAALGQGGILNGEAAVSVANTGVAANLTNGTATATVALPGNTTTVVVSPNLSVTPPSLITAGPVLGNATAIVQPVVNSASSALNTTATNLSRLCVLKICH